MTHGDEALRDFQFFWGLAMATISLFRLLIRWGY